MASQPAHASLIGRRSWPRRAVRLVLLPLVALVLIGRGAAPALLRWRIERQIQRSGWTGDVGLVDVSFTQARVQIADLRLRSPHARDRPQLHPWLTLDVPTLDVDCSLTALVHGRFVGDVVVDRPHLEFATLGRGEGSSDHPLWREGLRISAPVKIRHLEIRDGDVRWRRLAPPASLRLAPVDARVEDLDDRSDAPARATIRARTTGGGDLVADGAVEPFAPAPTGAISMVLRGVALEELQPLWWPQRIEVRSGRLDAFASVTLEHGRLRGSIQPIARDLDLEEVRRQAGHAGLGGLHDIIADLSSDVIERHGPLTAKVPVDVALDQPGAADALTRSLRQALTDELRNPPRREVTARLGASAGPDRAADLDLDILNAGGSGWRFGGGLDARRQAAHRGAFVEIVAGAGIWLGLIRLDGLPFVGIGAATDDRGGGRHGAVSYGARADATVALGRASVGIRIAWQSARDLRDDRTWSSPSAGLLLGYRF